MKTFMAIYDIKERERDLINIAAKIYTFQGGIENGFSRDSHKSNDCFSK